jgi:hypothetical protein
VLLQKTEIYQNINFNIKNKTSPKNTVLGIQTPKIENYSMLDYLSLSLKADRSESKPKILICFLDKL